MPYDKATALAKMKAFYKKYRTPLTRTPTYDTAEQSLFFAKKYSDEHITAAGKIRKAFRKHIGEDKLITFKRPPRNFDFYKADFWDFIGNETGSKKVKRSTNMKKVKELSQKLDEGDWQADILQIDPAAFESMKEVFKLLSIVDGGQYTKSQLAQNIMIQIPYIHSLRYETMDRTDAEKCALAIIGCIHQKIPIANFLEFLRENNLEHFVDANIRKQLEKSRSPNVNEELTKELEAVLEKLKVDDISKLQQIASKFETDQIAFQDLFNQINTALDNLPHSKHMFYALSAYAAGNITREQMDSVLLRHQLAQHVGKVEVIPIIDDEGKFTPEIQPYLEKIIPQHSDNQTIREKFRHNLLAVPKSERVLFSFNPSNLYLNKAERKNYTFHHLPGTSFDFDQAQLAATGAMDALGVAIYDDKYVKSQGRLGIFTLLDQGRSASLDMRYRGTPYPGAAHTFWVHEKFYSLFFGGYYHDTTHGASSSPLANNIKETLTRLEYVLRDVSAMPWSKETWELVDRAFAEDQVNWSPEQVEVAYDPDAKYIIQTLLQVIGKDDDAYLLNNVAFLSFALDFVRNTKWYEEHRMTQSDFEGTHASLSTLFKYAAAIKDQIVNDPLDLQVIKLAAFVVFNTQKAMTKPEKDDLFAKIDEAYQAKLIGIYKEKPSNFLRIKFLEDRDPNFVIPTREVFLAKLSEQQANLGMRQKL